MKNDLIRDVFTKNPVFVLTLGLCPALAVTTTLYNAVGLGVAVILVLVCSDIFISVFVEYFPAKIRSFCIFLIIGTVVSVVEMLIEAYFPALDKSLGIFIPLIVVNCVVLKGAQECFSNCSVITSVYTALKYGFNFLIALVLISVVREFLGTGYIFGTQITPYFSEKGLIKPIAFMITPSGALIVVALFISLSRLKMGDRT